MIYFICSYINKMAGYLEITFGPMFSGKTTSIIDKANRFISLRTLQSRPSRILIINYSEDNRKTITKDGLTPHVPRTIIHNKNSSCIKVTTLSSIDISAYDYIVVDESQFFTDLVESVLGWLVQGKHVHCAGLVADSNRRIFGNLCQLIPRADEVEQLKAFCSMCGDKILNAPFTRCLKDKSHQKLIGDDIYSAVCGVHWV